MGGVEAGTAGFFGDFPFEWRRVGEVVVRRGRRRFDPQEDFAFRHRFRFFGQVESVPVDGDHVFRAAFRFEGVLPFPVAAAWPFVGVAAGHPHQAFEFGPGENPNDRRESVFTTPDRHPAGAFRFPFEPDRVPSRENRDELAFLRSRFEVGPRHRDRRFGQHIPDQHLPIRKSRH